MFGQYGTVSDILSAARYESCFFIAVAGADHTKLSDLMAGADQLIKNPTPTQTLTLGTRFIMFTPAQ